MREYPVPAVRAVIVAADGRVACVEGAEGWRLPGGPLKGGETWAGAIEARLGELGVGRLLSVEFIGMAEPEEWDGEWYLAADFRVQVEPGERGALCWQRPEGLAAELRKSISAWEKV